MLHDSTILGPLSSEQLWWLLLCYSPVLLFGQSVNRKVRGRGGLGDLTVLPVSPF